MLVVLGLCAVSQTAPQRAGLTVPGVVVALKAEARALTKCSMAPGQLVQLPGGVFMRLSGIGARSARLAAKDLVKKGASALISWGSAGGLDPKLSPGSLVLPERVLNSDQKSFSADRTWNDRLLTRLKGRVELHTGPLIQSSSVLKTPTEKTALFEQSGAVAVDMESAAVANVALKAQMPFVAIRAVLDPADMSLPPSVWAATDELWRLRPLRLLKGLARHPQEFYLLIQLVRNFCAARATLTNVVQLTGHRFLSP